MSGVPIKKRAMQALDILATAACDAEHYEYIALVLRERNAKLNYRMEQLYARALDAEQRAHMAEVDRDEWRSSYYEVQEELRAQKKQQKK
jgi:hypothetical protein